VPTSARGFSPASRARLTAHDLGRFPSGTLFDRVWRAVCEAGCLPRKELFEAWEVARRARRWFRGGRVIDLGAGHGLLAQIMLILDDSSPRALAIDAALPDSASRVHDALVKVWPRLAIDATRVARLQAGGYRVRTQVIPANITPKNRLILAEPIRQTADRGPRGIATPAGVNSN
jgi:hypothetical protein